MTDPIFLKTSDNNLGKKKMTLLKRNEPCSDKRGLNASRRCRIQPAWVAQCLTGGCEFDAWLRQTFFSAYFCLSCVLKHVRKVVDGFGKKVVLVLVCESQETRVSLTVTI